MRHIHTPWSAFAIKKWSLTLSSPPSAPSSSLRAPLPRSQPMMSPSRCRAGWAPVRDSDSTARSRRPSASALHNLGRNGPAWQPASERFENKGVTTDMGRRVEDLERGSACPPCVSVCVAESETDREREIKAFLFDACAPLAFSFLFPSALLFLGEREVCLFLVLAVSSRAIDGCIKHQIFVFHAPHSCRCHRHSFALLTRSEMWPPIGRTFM